MDLSKEEKELLLSTYKDNGVLTFDKFSEDRQKLKLSDEKMADFRSMQFGKEDMKVG